MTLPFFILGIVLVLAGGALVIWAAYNDLLT